MWCKIVVQFHSFVCGCPIFPTPFVEEIFFASLYILGSSVFHPSPDQAWPYLASEIRCDLEYSGWYGHRSLCHKLINHTCMGLFLGSLLCSVDYVSVLCVCVCELCLFIPLISCGMNLTLDDLIWLWVPHRSRLEISTEITWLLNFEQNTWWRC